MQVVYSIGARLAAAGIGNTAYQAVRRIHAAGHLGRVFCLGSEPCELPGGVVSSVWFPSRRWLRLPTYRYYLLKDWWFDRRVARRLGEPFDLFHGWNSHCLESLERARACGAVTIVERGSAHPMVQAKLLREEHERFGQPVPGGLTALAERCAAECERADFVHVPSSFCRQSFLDEGFEPERLLVSPYGVDIERFTVQPHPARFAVAFLGAIGLRKGVADLLEAWARLELTDSRLVLWGGIERDAEALVNGYRSWCQFETPGFATDPAKALAEASVLVLPAIEDGFPLVVLEAMACGRAVIVSENTGSRDALVEGESGFVVPIRSPDAIAEKLQWLHDNPDACRAMGLAARKRAEKFTWDRYGQAILDAYRQVLQRRGDASE